MHIRTPGGSSGTASDPPAESCSSSLPQTPLLGSRSGAGGGRDGWGWISEIPLMPMLGFSHCVSCSEHALLWNCRAGSRAVPTRSPPRELARCSSSPCSSRANAISFARPSPVRVCAALAGADRQLSATGEHTTVECADTALQYLQTYIQYARSGHVTRHGDTIGAIVRDVLYEVSLSRGNYSSTTVVYKQCC